LKNDVLSDNDLTVMLALDGALSQFDLGRDALRMARELAERRANDALVVELLDALYDQAAHIGLVVTMLSWRTRIGEPLDAMDGTERERGRRLYRALMAFEDAYAWVRPDPS